MADGFLTGLLLGAGRGFVGYQQGREEEAERLRQEEERERRTRLLMIEEAVAALRAQNELERLTRGEPLRARVSRGGVTVEGVPLEQVDEVLAGLPEEDPEEDPNEGLTAWQRYQIRQQQREEQIESALAWARNWAEAGISVDIIARWLRLPPANLDHGTALRVAQQARDEVVSRQLAEERARQLIAGQGGSAGLQSLMDLLGQGQGEGSPPQQPGGSGLPFRRQGAVAAPAAPPPGVLSDQEVEIARALVRSLPEATARQVLAQAGYTASQIAQILQR
ncbi:MAG TPA: hypothetical protein VIL20_22430 [Sandaracinaceae bacterium]